MDSQAAREESVVVRTDQDVHLGVITIKGDMMLSTVREKVNPPTLCGGGVARLNLACRSSACATYGLKCLRPGYSSRKV